MFSKALSHGEMTGALLTHTMSIMSKVNCWIFHPVSRLVCSLHVPSVDNGLDDFAIHISFRGDLLRKHIFLPLSPKNNSLSRSLVSLHDPLVRQLASVEAVVLGKIFSNISLRSPFPQLDAPINMKKCRLSCFSEKMLEKRPKENNLRHYRDRGWTRSHAMQRCRPALVTSQTLKSLFSA